MKFVIFSNQTKDNMKNYNSNENKKKRPREEDFEAYKKRTKRETYTIIVCSGPGQREEIKVDVYDETF
jgi:hypothetical protein